MLIVPQDSPTTDDENTDDENGDVDGTRMVNVSPHPKGVPRPEGMPPEEALFPGEDTSYGTAVSPDRPSAVPLSCPRVDSLRFAVGVSYNE